MSNSIYFFPGDAKATLGEVIPCVAGVENATTLWQDGTLVEVDGSAGIFRTVEKS